MFALSNSTIDAPWKKTTDGCKEFSKIVNKYNRRNNRKQYGEDTDNNTDIVSRTNIDYDIDYEYDNNSNTNCVTRNKIICNDEDNNLFFNSGIDGSTYYDSDNNNSNTYINNKHNKNNNNDNAETEFDSGNLFSVDSCYYSESECESIGLYNLNLNTYIDINIISHNLILSRKEIFCQLCNNVSVIV